MPYVLAAIIGMLFLTVFIVALAGHNQRLDGTAPQPTAIPAAPQEAPRP